MGVINLAGPVSINLGEVKDELVPVGWHSVTIERVDAGMTKDEKYPKFFVMSRISDDADPDNNRTIVWNLTFNFTNQSGNFVKRCFAAIGMPMDLNYPSYTAMAEDMIGRECDAYVKHGEYQGEAKTDVSKWRAPSFDDLEL